MRYLEDHEKCDLFKVQILRYSINTISIEKKTVDIDNLSSNLLKAVAFEISAPLSFIFNKSLESGVVPRKLKVSRTVGIYKSGSPSDLTNYRPISCPPILSKIIEKMVTKQFNEYLNTNNLLKKHQYDFQSNKSTVHALLHAIDFIIKAFSNN